jgi:hypothetical protein
MSTAMILPKFRHRDPEESWSMPSLGSALSPVRSLLAAIALLHHLQFLIGF